MSETPNQDVTFDPETGARDIIDLSAPAPSPDEATSSQAPFKSEQPSTSETAGTPTESSNSETVGHPKRELSEIEMANITQGVITALKTVYDPEIPVDIYELGLIYRVDYDPDTARGGKITVDMTLTAPGCPVAGEMPGWVEDAVLTVDGVDDVSVNMTFEPPWSPERMSEEARLELGWM